MTSLKEKAKRRMAQAGFAPDRCGVRGCSNGDAEVVELLPFDPIDHDSTHIQLCPDHQEWAAERNVFAEAMTDELREKRKRIGQEHIDRIQQLAPPQDGDLREDILMGEAEGQIPLSDAHDPPTGPSLVGGDDS